MRKMVKYLVVLAAAFGLVWWSAQQSREREVSEQRVPAPVATELDPDVGDEMGTFGYIAVGGNSEAADVFRGSKFTSPADDGIAEYIGVYVDNSIVGVPGNVDAKAAIYEPGGDLLGGTEEVVIAPNYVGWKRLYFPGGGPGIIGSTDYVIVIWMSTNEVHVFYDPGDPNQGHFDGVATPYNGWPDPVGWANNNNKYSIFCAYGDYEPPLDAEAGSSYGVGTPICGASLSSYAIFGGGQAPGSYAVRQVGEHPGSYAAFGAGQAPGSYGVWQSGSAPTSYGVIAPPHGRARASYAVLLEVADNAPASYAVGLKVVGQAKVSYGVDLPIRGSAPASYGVAGTASAATTLLMLLGDDPVPS